MKKHFQLCKKYKKLIYSTGLSIHGPITEKILGSQRSQDWDSQHSDKKRHLKDKIMVNVQNWSFKRVNFINNL